MFVRWLVVTMAVCGVLAGPVTIRSDGGLEFVTYFSATISSSIFFHLLLDFFFLLLTFSLSFSPLLTFFCINWLWQWSGPASRYNFEKYSLVCLPKLFSIVCFFFLVVGHFPLVHTCYAMDMDSASMEGLEKRRWRKVNISNLISLIISNLIWYFLHHLDYIYTVYIVSSINMYTIIQYFRKIFHWVCTSLKPLPQPKLPPVIAEILLLETSQIRGSTTTWMLPRRQLHKYWPKTQSYLVAHVSSYKTGSLDSL